MKGASSMAERFLDTYEREHAVTMRVLRAYPVDKLDLRPHPKCKTARELAWMFVLERGLGTSLYHDAFANGMPAGRTLPPAPDSWDDLLAALEKAHAEFGNLVRGAADEDLAVNVRFFVAPKTLGDMSRHDVLWMLLHDQIHHRGQFTIYLRMAEGKVPSVYGPTADEPWM